ncbi:MAG: hypothetical protein D6677_04640 [Calditrichaeota bacterium]|nr:MAG: hypothetical protein D6677_04640 [Calditrichota bacterium]
MDVTSLYANQGSVQYLVEQFMRFEQEPLNQLTERKNKLNDTTSLLSTLDSKLSALQSRTKRMTDQFTDYFAARKAESSNKDLFTASATSEANTGSHAISVARLASADTRVSQQYSSTASDFTSYTTDQTFTIEVAHPTDADANNRVFISVTVDASVFSGDNESVLKAISSAVDAAMDQAVADETIKNEERVNTSVVSEQNGTSRLQFISNNSGYTYRIDFGTSTLLDDLQINANSASSGTSGGYIHNVGSSATTSELNAQFTIDGLTYYRDSSTVDDAIKGVTLNLRDVFATDETVTVSTDYDAVKEEVDGFIKAYNEAIDFLRKEAQYDPTKGERGALADDLKYRNLSVDLRDIISSEVTDVTYTDYNLLYDIGMEMDQQGKLSITDEDKFRTAVETNSEYVSDIFNGSDGIATRINDYLEDYVKTGGTISQSKKNITSQIQTLETRIDLENTLLDQKRKQLTDQFIQLQDAMYTVQSQQQFFSLFSASISAGGGLF